jgi:hypothetical protein
MKRINTVMDCVLTTQLCTVVAGTFTFVAHRIDIGIIFDDGIVLSHDFVWISLIIAGFFMLIPYLAWYNYLNNQCADNEQQAVLDITETIRCAERPERWETMWKDIRESLRFFHTKPAPETSCSCHLHGAKAQDECNMLGCPDRRTGIYTRY